MIIINTVQLMGRLVKDVEVRYTQGEKPIACGSYTLAVNRSFKKEGQPDADFISCKVFGKSAEFAAKYFTKGMQVAVTGRIQTGSYENEGKKIYTTDIIVNDQFFADSRKDNTGSNSNISSNVDDGFYPIAEGVEDSDLPF